MPRITPDQKRKGLIAKIHVAKTQLNMEDDVYRNFCLKPQGQAAGVLLVCCNYNVSLPKWNSSALNRHAKTSAPNRYTKPMYLP